MFKTSKKPLQSILVKPAGPDCNMACKYCFYLEKSALYSFNQIHRMSNTILEETIHQMMVQSGTNVSFGWQGGEPTLMGLDFYQTAVQYQQKYGTTGQTVGNGLQTNGLLINNDWCKFLKEYKFLVGLSLDGPEHIHDHYRVTQGGHPTWKKVSTARDRMLDNEVEVNALVVVNDYSVQFPEEIYKYHKENGLVFQQYIPCVETDRSERSKAASFSVLAETFGAFLCTIFDLWMGDFRNSEPTTFIRMFDSLFYSYVGMQPPECTLLPECGNYIVIEHNGDVYSCDFFVEPEWKLGNVMQDNLIELLNSDTQNSFGQLKSDYPIKCMNCKWLKYCHGGCTKDRIRDPRDNGISHFCQAYKIFFEYAHERILHLAERWVTEHSTDNSIIKSTFMTRKIGRNDPCPCGSGRKYKKCCGITV